MSDKRDINRHHGLDEDQYGLSSTHMLAAFICVIDRLERIEKKLDALADLLMPQTNWLDLPDVATVENARLAYETAHKMLRVNGVTP